MTRSEGYDLKVVAVMFFIGLWVGALLANPAVWPGTCSPPAAPPNDTANSSWWPTGKAVAEHAVDLPENPSNARSKSLTGVQFP